MGKKDVISKVATIDIENENDSPEEIPQINQFERFQLFDTSIDNIMTSLRIHGTFERQLRVIRTSIIIDNFIKELKELLDKFIKHMKEHLKESVEKLKKQKIQKRNQEIKKIQKENQKLLKKKIKNTAKLYNYGKKTKKNNKWR